MILECQACRARFKLDESRIKGKGARIRCRKCGESIIVMKSDIPAAKPSPPVGKELFDLRSILREPEKRTPVQPQDEVDAAFERLLHPGRERDEAAPEPAQPPGLTAPPLRDEVDEAFDRLLHQDREPEGAAQVPPESFAEDTPPRREEADAVTERPRFEERAAEPEPPSVTEEPASEPEPPSAMAEPPAPAKPEPEEAPQEFAEPFAEIPPPSSEEIDSSFGSSLFEEPASEPEPPSAMVEPPAPAEPEPEEAPQEFAETFAEVPPPAQEEVDSSFESPLFGEVEPDRETDLRLPRESEEPPPPEHPAPAGNDLLVASAPEEEETERGGEPAEFLILDDGPSDVGGKDGFAADQAGPFDPSDRLRQAPRWTLEEDAAPAPVTPPPAQFTATPADMRAETIQDELAGLAERDSGEETFAPEPPPPDLPPPKPPVTERIPVERPRVAEPSRRPSVTLLVLLFLTLAGAGAYLAFTKTGQETLRSIVPGMESFWLGGKKTVRPLKVENPIGFYETGKGAEKLFVIKGAVTNQGRSAKSGIRVRAELLDVDHKNIGELTVYAGNVISGLSSANREGIEAAMSNRFGDKLINVDVSPGKSVPFMVVFIDPPEGIEEYRLEALEGD